jgi:hypothetical protein
MLKSIPLETAAGLLFLALVLVRATGLKERAEWKPSVIR